VGFKGTEFFEEVRNKELKPFTKPEELLLIQSIYTRIKPNVDKLFALQPQTKFEIRRTKLLENKQRVPSTIKELQTERDQEFLCSYSDVANYNVW
jgi:hypothetical protein